MVAARAPGGSGSSALTDILNGNIHLFGGSSGPSVKSVEAKVAKDPTNPKLRLQLAQLLVTKNQVDDAIPAWKSYLKLKPGDTEGLLGLAGVYSTKMIPNNELEPDARFRKLDAAVKLARRSKRRPDK